MTHKFKYVLAIDQGTSTRSYCVHDHTTAHPGSFPGDGPTRPAAIFLDKSKNGAKPVFGGRALALGHAKPQFLHTQVKRAFNSDPGAPWNNSNIPAYQLFAYEIEDTYQAALKLFPHIGSEMKKNRDNVAVVLTVPALFSEQEKSWILRGIREFTSVDPDLTAFVPEPVGVIYQASAQFRSEIRRGSHVAILDIGGGTFDISVLHFTGTQFDEVVGNRGCTLAGEAVTAAVAKSFAAALGYKEKPAACFDPVCGLNLQHPNLPASYRRVFFSIAKAAEKAKIAVSDDEEGGEIPIPVELDKKTVELPFNRDKLRELAAEIYTQIEEAISSALDGSSLGWGGIEHVMLAGGSARLVDMPEIAARATGRPVESVWLSADTTHAICKGAATRIFLGDQTAMCIAGGLAYSVVETDSKGKPLSDNGRPRKLLRWMIGPGESVAAGGRELRTDDQFVTCVGAGKTRVELEFFGAKPGVQKVCAGRPCLGPMDEAIALRKTTVEPVLPKAGKYQTRVTIRMTPTGRCFADVSFIGAPDQEPISVAIEGQAGTADVEGDQTPSCDVVLFIMDCSGSMAAASKIDNAKKAIEHFVSSVSSPEVQFGLIPFGSVTRVAGRIGTPQRDVVRAANRMAAGGGTPLAEALALGCKELSSIPKDVNTVAVVVCDGHPNDREAAKSEATQLKKRARIFCIGIGTHGVDLDGDFLRGIASSPSDYQEGHATQVVSMFQNILNLCFVPH